MTLISITALELTKEGAGEHVAGGLDGRMQSRAVIDVIVDGGLFVNLRTGAQERLCWITTLNQ